MFNYKDGYSDQAVSLFIIWRFVLLHMNLCHNT